MPELATDERFIQVAPMDEPRALKAWAAPAPMAEPIMFEVMLGAPDPVWRLDSDRDLRKFVDWMAREVEHNPPAGPYDFDAHAALVMKMLGLLAAARAARP